MAKHSARSRKTLALSELVALGDLQARLSHIFPTRASLDWHLRMHRAAHVEAGAIFDIGPGLMAHPPTFEKVVLAIGAAEAKRRLP